MNAPDLILHNGRITTLDDLHPQVSAVAISDAEVVTAVAFFAGAGFLE